MLRNEQKTRRRAKIMSSIRAFLARNAFDELTMDSIAAASRISVGTLYNYYGGKEAMIIAYCRDQMSEYFEQARRLTESPPRSAEEAYAGLLAIYMKGFCRLDRSLISFVIRIAIENQLQGKGRTGFQNLAFMQIKEVTRKLKEMGSMPESAQEDSIAFILFGICTDLLFQYSLCGEVGIDSQIERLHQCINLVYTGMGARRDIPTAPVD